MRNIFISYISAEYRDIENLTGKNCINNKDNLSVWHVFIKVLYKFVKKNYSMPNKERSF